ncbi:hypothetical protein [Sphaerisporangium dianthi]|uniref:Uncharacterized protein n=1 Tax=Sphaerisporangium dianthi TaxID=1436120 RepID=A0ABV9CHC2_9ACTN
MDATPDDAPRDAAQVTPEDSYGDAARVTPEEAARTLREIRDSQARVIRARPWFPAWYTTGLALYITGVQFCTERGTPGPVMVAGLIVLTLAMGGMVGAVVFVRRQRPHRSLVTWRLLVSYAAWLMVAIALSTALALPLAMAGVPYARTYAGLTMTAYMAVTGPLIGWWMTRRIAAAIEAG